MTLKMRLTAKHGFGLLAGIFLAAMLVSQAGIADSNGYWAFKMTEAETPSKEDLGKYCSYKGDGNRSGLLGLAHFETKCYSPTFNTTTTYAGNMAWGYHTQFDRPEVEFNQGLDVLIPGKLIGFALTATSTSQANGVSAWVSMGWNHPGSGSVSVGGTPGAPAGGKAVGKGYAKVFGKPNPQPNGKLPQLALEFVVSGGNAQRGIKVRYLYDWVQGGPGQEERRPEPQHAANFLGCYKDAWDRDLSGYTFNDPGMTTQKCIAACVKKGFAYAATQYASHCFCANNFGKHGKATNCDMPCGGNKAEICGGNFANSVYGIDGGGVYPPPQSSPPRLEGAWRAVWEAKGLDKSGYRITQDASGNLTFIAPDGNRSNGRFIGSQSVEATDWGGGKGSISRDGETIKWDNGSRWIRAQGAPPPPPPSPSKSLTGAWVHSADGSTQTPDSKVIVLHEGKQVTLVGTYKMAVNRNLWQTFRCVGQLSGNELPMQCRWIEGGNPMSYADWSLNFQVSPDRNHLDYIHTKSGPGQDSHYSRVP